MPGSLKVALFQAEADPSSDVSARLDYLDSALQFASDESADLLVTPELYLSGYNVGDLIGERACSADSAEMEKLCELACKNNVALVCGYPERDGDNIYNSAILINRNGEIVANHRKIKLPSDFEKAHFSHGTGATLVELDGWKIALLICYDVEFPEFARQGAVSGASLVVAPTALREKWSVVSRCLIPTRAFENRLFVAYANFAGTEGDWQYYGGSRICGPNGDDMAVAGPGEAIVMATLDPEAIDEARGILNYLPDLEK